ncbi:TQO small subunit DoxD domain-containing protein [Pseudopedobacter saltans DSM 12145]|uniref:TQO small subunit DoxD domain-containing protein n=1 Tax=Pseudopedobacter saltans (strain ATCC 51119 / DSM 12145 / JCM 21818 / CCUG 39354 / LMG 10337 / NBRC 100064 / NCIMB 13643) TaxID=762903 RepID=F0S7E0_PSESL|nr:TQO small subunit DoxD [Pseudopedobacter saltans]ADY51165.1 TQO small subunit DoxD domain-containing protein [Pseudopedobacter saltans DSM 12145]
MDANYKNQFDNVSGLFTLALRWVIGWTYFSAFWRRLILDNKLIPEEAGYIGEKFNHFLPNALGIKPIIEYLVSNPDALQISMVTFTIVEAIVGLLIIAGFFTRLMSIGVFFLAMGILLGSGWLGTTCLDEWQIGVLGVAGGFTLFLTGSSNYSLDYYLMNKSCRFTNKKWFAYLGSGALPIKNLAPKVLIMSVFIFGLTLFTNQYFHGGVFGRLHNKSVKPKVEISNVKYDGSQLTFQIFRVEGADVYGSFLIGIQILDENNQLVKSIGQDELSRFPKEKINNHYVAKIKPGKHSLIIPLGAKADVTLDMDDIIIKKDYTLKLIDISGIEWVENIIQ